MFEFFKKLKDIAGIICTSYAFLAWFFLTATGFIQMHRADKGISPNALDNDFVIGVIKTDVVLVCVKEDDLPPECIRFEAPKGVKILLEPYKSDPSKKILTIKK